MPNIDLGALTIPAFATIFGAGWTSCFAIMVRPMRERMTQLEAKLDAINQRKDERIKALEDRLGL